MKRSHKRSEERLEKLDEHGLQCCQELVNVCKLKDALVCDLKAENGSRIFTEKQERAYDKDQFEVIDEGPPDSITILLVLLFCCTTGYESITDEAIDGRCRGRGQLGSFWGE